MFRRHDRFFSKFCFARAGELLCASKFFLVGGNLRKVSFKWIFGACKPENLIEVNGILSFSESKFPNVFILGWLCVCVCVCIFLYSWFCFDVPVGKNIFFSWVFVLTCCWQTPKNKSDGLDFKIKIK